MLHAVNVLASGDLLYVICQIAKAKADPSVYLSGAA